MTAPADLFAALLAQLIDRDESPGLGQVTPWARAPGPKQSAARFLLAAAGLPIPDDGPAVGPGFDFFEAMSVRIRREVNDAAGSAPGFQRSLESAAAQVSTIEDVWSVTFPEGLGVLDRYEEHRDRLRERRRLHNVRATTDPVSDPMRQVLITANVLVAGDRYDRHYDHPIPMDAPPADTELAHGLRHLDRAVAVDLDRNRAWRPPLHVALSVSSTSDGDEGEAAGFVREIIADTGPFPHLRLYVFDEFIARRIASTLELGDAASVFGVSGEYGRHYSFLKAIAAVWAVCVDPGVAATFKIDLDQTFSQHALIRQTGHSAFEHLTTDLWGGQAVGSDGRTVDLGLIAGGLVNADDAESSVFTPDVRLSPPEVGEDAIFCSRIPQALSTEAEICATVADGAIERVHVTGGTNGVRVDALRRWRPFVPSFVGRAEDQAYILSARDGGPNRLGYLHAPGLRMRHDKDRIIPDVIASGSADKHIGDLVRMRLFTALGSGHKDYLNPFTGAFVSRLPLTVTALRFAIHALGLAAPEVDSYLISGAARLSSADEQVLGLEEAVAAERRAWHRLYDRLEDISAGLAEGNRASIEVADAISSLVDEAAVI